MVMPSSVHSQASDLKNVNDFTINSNLIINEKVSKSNGEILFKKYAKGRFLGKVSITRAVLQNAMSLSI